MNRERCIFKWSDNNCYSSKVNPTARPVSKKKCEKCTYYKSITEHHKILWRVQIINEIKRLKKALRALDGIN
jgi:hypothetical protein